MPTPAPLGPAPIRFETRLSDLVGPVALEDADGVLTIAEVLPGAGGQAKVRLTRDGAQDPTQVARVNTATELGDFVVRNLPTKTMRAFALPPGRAFVEHRLTRLLARSMGALLCMGLSVAVVLLAPSPMLKALLAMALALLTLVILFYKPRGMSGVHSLYKVGPHTYEFGQLLSDRPRVEAAEAMVDEIKEHYGALLSDIVLRIEAPALFDPANEATRRFTSALLAWDSRTQDLSGAEVSTLAAQVRVHFDAARSNAEALGIGYLPAEAQEPAGRALKAARLAKEGSTEGERTSAMKQVAAILDTLAIYYLPNPTEAQRMIEGRRLLELPGRRSTDA